jgi:hypothetical protein
MSRLDNIIHFYTVFYSGDCLEVCTKPLGCALQKDTHTICKLNNPHSYNKLNTFFE